MWYSITAIYAYNSHVVYNSSHIYPAFPKFSFTLVEKWRNSVATCKCVKIQGCFACWIPCLAVYFINVSNPSSITHFKTTVEIRNIYTKIFKRINNKIWVDWLRQYFFQRCSEFLIDISKSKLRILKKFVLSVYEKKS